MKTNDVNSLNHMTWNCKYHIVFAPNPAQSADPLALPALCGRVPEGKN